VICFREYGNSNGCRSNESVRRVRTIAALLALAGLGLPAIAGTVSFTLNLSTVVVGVTPPGSPPGTLSFDPTNFTGTMAPFGACQFVVAPPGANQSSAGLGITITLANGTAITASTTSTGGTITGGTGIFAGATGSFQGTPMPVGGAPAGSVKFVLTGSGNIDAPDAPGGVDVLPATIQIQAPQGSTATVSSSLILTNQGFTAIGFTPSVAVTSQTDWLSVPPNTGTIAPGGSSSIQVTANPSGLPLGVYQGHVNLDLGGSSIIVPVLLTVEFVGGSLQLSETGASFKTVAGGPAPAAQTIQVQNTGVGNLTGLTATTTINGSEANWLNASIAPGFASQTQTPVTVTVDPGSLPAGTYYGEVNFNLPKSANSPQSVSVQMQVLPGPPPPTFKPAAVFMQTTVNVTAQTLVWGPDPPSQTVTITNPGTENLSFTVKEDPATAAAVASGDLAWFMFSPTAGSLAPGQTAQINISVTPNCLETLSCVQTVSLSGSGNNAYLDVNFPAINYTYSLHTSFGADQVYDGNCPPNQGCETFGGDFKPAPRLVLPKGSAVVSCNLTLLRGLFTSIGPNFQATVGQPEPLEAQIYDDCGTTLDSGAVVATFSSADPPVVLNPLGAGQWAATWTPQNAAANVVVNLEAASPIGIVGLLAQSGSVTASTSTPIIDAGGITNAASGAPVIAPGAFIAIYGANLAGGTTVASSPTFPTSLGSTQVFLGGQSLPLYFTANQQIDAIVPYGINPNSSQQLIIQSGATLSQPEPVIVAAAQPGVFTQNQSGSGPGAILGQKPGGVAALNTSANPASAGDALLIYCTGLGTVTPAVAAGSPAPASTLSKTDNAVTATVGGQNAQVLFAGLAPGFVGLYQVNVIVPSGIVAADDVPVVLTEAGALSAPVTVAIQ
jgi:uncharacterized protein (TIGR03437 family)